MEPNKIFFDLTFEKDELKAKSSLLEQINDELKGKSSLLEQLNTIVWQEQYLT